MGLIWYVIVLDMILVGALVGIYFLLRLPRSSKNLNAPFKALTIGHRGFRPIFDSNTDHELSANSADKQNPLEKELNIPVVPENSMSAFEFAADNGAQGIEFDIRMTSDCVPVVIHDMLVDRVLNGKGSISDMTWKQVSELHYLTGPENQTLPTLEETILFAKKRGIKMMIEVKETKRAAALLKMLSELFAKHDLYQTAYVAHFNPLFLYQLRKADPKIAVSFLFRSDLIDIIHRTPSLGVKLPFPLTIEAVRKFVDATIVFVAKYVLPDLIDLDLVSVDKALVNEQLVRYFTSRGIVVNAWVVNSIEEKEKLLKLGVAVTTDSLPPALQERILKLKK